MDDMAKYINTFVYTLITSGYPIGDSMDESLMKEIGITDDSISNVVDYTQLCINVYEQALKDMGIFFPEVTTTFSTSEILLNLRQK